MSVCSCRLVPDSVHSQKMHDIENYDLVHRLCTTDCASGCAFPYHALFDCAKLMRTKYLPQPREKHGLTIPAAAYMLAADNSAQSLTRDPV